MDDKERIEELRKYIHELGYDEQQLKDSLFSISFSVGEAGTVDVTIQWPEKITETATDYVSTLLYSVNEGLLKNMMIDAITDSYVKYPEIKDEVEEIVEKWLVLQTSSSDTPCIKPTETLRGS